MAGIAKSYHKKLMESTADEWREVLRRHHKQFAEMLNDAELNTIDYKKLSKKASDIHLLNVILIEKLEKLMEEQTK